METVVQVFEVEGLGPVVPTSAILCILRDLQDAGIGGDGLIEAIEMIVGVEAKCRMMRAPVRLRPLVPGGSVYPHIETVTYPGE